ncbi:MAG: hypothetical protein GY795_29960 [Desulfobacterales bacterium]|nr:hypothetical protein [Desulfobacterales bacterium]
MFSGLLTRAVTPGCPQSRTLTVCGDGTDLDGGNITHIIRDPETLPGGKVTRKEIA